jgi:hypothetical protein
MSFDFLNKSYGLNIKRGTRCTYTGEGDAKHGSVTSAQGGYVRIRFDGDKRSMGPFHPTWQLTYKEQA